MPNVLDANGLTTQSQTELIDFFTTQYENIYGADVNLASDTPDGQMMNINVQVILDILDLVTTVYNSFDPDNAVGVVLDQRVSINGIQRQPGTYTVTPITIVNTISINLVGLDDVDTDEDPTLYTVSDNAGNKWFLITSEVGLAAGTHVLSFRSAVPGAVLTTPNTITVPVTIVLGVASINNPSSYTTLGANEESDPALKIRRQKSVSLASQGYYRGLKAALENITGVTSAFIYENDTDTTDSDSVPNHSIWVIVAGSGAAASIAQAIYTKRNAGCGMFGEESYVVTQIDGSPFTVYWDNVDIRRLFIAFTVTSIDGVVASNVAGIREGLPALFVPTVFQEVNINALATQVQVIDPNTLVTNAGFSSGELQTLNLSGVAASGAFVVNYAGIASASIAWNDAIGTIQTKIQAMAGLSAATVTGSIASQSLVFDLSNVGGPQGLLTVSPNTLATVAPVAITFTYNIHLTNTLLPATKQNQFVVSVSDIVIVPMQLKPFTSVLAVATDLQMFAYGGYGAYVYSILINNSGGTINASTGLYTSGALSGQTDTLKAVDAMGNSATATVATI